MRVVFGVVWCGCVLGREGLGVFVQGGCCVLVGLVVLVRGLRPVPPCFWSVGGGAPVGAVRAEDAGLCVVETWGLSPHTPVEEAVQGCPPVLRGMVEVCRLVRWGFFRGRR